MFESLPEGSGDRGYARVKSGVRGVRPPHARPSTGGGDFGTVRVDNFMGVPSGVTGVGRPGERRIFVSDMILYVTTYAVPDGYLFASPTVKDDVGFKSTMYKNWDTLVKRCYKQMYPTGTKKIASHSCCKSGIQAIFSSGGTSISLVTSLGGSRSSPPCSSTTPLSRWSTPSSSSLASATSLGPRSLRLYSLPAHDFHTRFDI